MTDYTELVKALRHCISDPYGFVECDGCPIFCKGIDCQNKLHADAADAIEALQTENTDIREELFVSQRKYDNFVAVASMENAMLARQMPKRGEWIDSKEIMRPDMCSVCGCIYEADRFMDKIAWNYCPNCGSQMRGEVNERD